MKTFYKTTLAIIICLMFFACESANAAVSGSCANCHTMHDSQGGVSVSGNPTTEGGSGALTKGDCVGCHTGDNVTGGAIPFVFSPDGPTYGTDTLAGGNFYWVVQSGAENYTKGHNVKGIPGMLKDLVLAKAPGGTVTCSDSLGCHDSLFEIATVDTGCQGCHLAPRHHAARQVDGPSLEEHGYFRFLSGHNTGAGYGVEGIEDADWQLTNSETDHNEYLGAVNNNTTGGFAGVGKNTMTAYCTGCHGNFHVQKSGDDWIRHPSDSLLSTPECEGYTVYDPKIPVARDALGTVASNAVDAEDMVMCLSCHRAHGSPYPDMLRWDYDGTIINNSSTDDTGCFKCHSTK